MAYYTMMKKIQLGIKVAFSVCGFKMHWIKCHLFHEFTSQVHATINSLHKWCPSGIQKLISNQYTITCRAEFVPLF